MYIFKIDIISINTDFLYIAIQQRKYLDILIM